MDIVLILLTILLTICVLLLALALYGYREFLFDRDVLQDDEDYARAKASVVGRASVAGVYVDAGRKSLSA